MKDIVYVYRYKIILTHRILNINDHINRCNRVIS